MAKSPIDVGARVRPISLPSTVRSFASGFAILLLLASIGCSGSSIPSSVQQGGTLMLPLAGTRGVPFGDDVWQPAYGGDTLSDYQNGQLVVNLFDPGTVNWRGSLTTRMTVVAEIPLEAELRYFQAAEGRQLMLIADVPIDFPVGVYDVRVVRMGPGYLGPASLQSVYKTITILPNTISFDDYLGNPVQVTAQSADGVMQNPLGVGPQYVLGAAAPRYSFRVFVNHVSDPKQNGFYSKVVVQYPESDIDIQDVVAVDPTFVTTWFEDGVPGPGQLTVHIAQRMIVDTSKTSGRFRVVYNLDDTSVPLDLANIGSSVVQVSDATGVDLTAANYEASIGW